MVRALVDTNVLVDYLRGVEAAARELSAYRKPAISIVSWMEVMVGASPESEPAVRGFLATFERLKIDEPVAELAVELRRKTRIKLPDALIWATAQVHGLMLVTRNTRDFDGRTPGIRVPYTL